MNGLNISHPTFNVIGLKLCTAILDLGFSVRLSKDVEIGHEAVFLSLSNIEDLVKKGVEFDLQVTVLCELLDMSYFCLILVPA